MQQRRDSLFVVIGVIVVVLLLISVPGMGMMNSGVMGSGMMGRYGGYSPWWGSLLMLLFWALLIGGVVLLAIWLVRQGAADAPNPGGDRALDILRERYARGELTREQYEQVRRDLEH